MVGNNCIYIIGFDIDFDRRYLIMLGQFSTDRIFKRHGGLRWQVLLILSSGKKRGVDLMDDIERAALGFWRPSPGTIYPLLKSLENESLVFREGNYYELTAAGKNAIGLTGEERRSSGNLREQMDRYLSETESYIQYLEDMKEHLTGSEERIHDMSIRLNDLYKDIRKRKEEK